MPFDSQITRSDTSALMPEEVSREIIQGAVQMSSVLQLGRRLPNMSRKQRRMPVLASLMTAYFVNGDTGLKQTAEIAWSNKFINAEELAVIVPIPENVLDDSDYDVWGEVTPRMQEAFGVAIDQAVFYGTNAPSDWPEDLVDGATAAGNAVALTAYADIYDAIMGTDGSLSKVELDGFNVNGHVAAMTMKSRLRGLRDSTGQPIYLTSMREKTTFELDGAPVVYPLNGAIDSAQSLLISGDWTQLVWSMRTDISYKLITEGVITDAAGNIVYNLPQQDMVALRAVIRLGWQLPNPINRLQPTEANRYPFAVLTAT